MIFVAGGVQITKKKVTAPDLSMLRSFTFSSHTHVHVDALLQVFMNFEGELT